MSDVRNEKLVRPRRPLLTAPRRRLLDQGGSAGSGSCERSGDPVQHSDEWVEESHAAQDEVVTQLAYVAPERDSVDDKLDMLLIQWHEYTEKYRLTRAYKAPAQSMGYITPKHHDWRHPEIEDEVDDRRTAQRVGECIARLEQPWQTAIVFQARNLATGRDVWFSPRLPADKEAREVILLEARNMVLIELRKEGVMT